MGRSVHITESERQLLLHALRIAVEDGSIFGEDAAGSAAFEKTNKQIQALQAKLRGKS